MEYWTCSGPLVEYWTCSGSLVEYLTCSGSLVEYWTCSGPLVTYTGSGPLVAYTSSGPLVAYWTGSGSLEKCLLKDGGSFIDDGLHDDHCLEDFGFDEKTQHGPPEQN